MQSIRNSYVKLAATPAGNATPVNAGDAALLNPVSPSLGNVSSQGNSEPDAYGPFDWKGFFKYMNPIGDIAAACGFYYALFSPTTGMANSFPGLYGDEWVNPGTIDDGLNPGVLDDVDDTVNNLSNQTLLSGDEWYQYFQETYGAQNVTWKATSFEHIVQHPEILYGLTQAEISNILGDGWTAGTYGSAGTGWKFTKGDLSVFYHPGGGIHGGSYYGFSSGLTGKVKIVGSEYVPMIDDSATIIQYGM